MGFIDQLIQGFSPVENYVLDLFSGGIVLQQSLVSKRRCIALCKDDLEAMNLETKCSQMLEDDPSIQEWCRSKAVVQKQVIELDDTERNALDDIETDEQPSGDDEDEEEQNIEKALSSSDEDEEVNLQVQESNTAPQKHEDTEKEVDNQNNSGAADGKQTMNGVEDNNEGNNKEEIIHAPQTIEEVNWATDKSNKDTNNLDESSKSGNINNVNDGKSVALVESQQTMLCSQEREQSLRNFCPRSQLSGDMAQNIETTTLNSPLKVAIEVQDKGKQIILEDEDMIVERLQILLVQWQKKRVTECRLVVDIEWCIKYLNRSTLEGRIITVEKVTECRLVVDPRSRESRGFCFVTMDSLEDVEWCIKYLNQSTLGGRIIIVEKVSIDFLVKDMFWRKLADVIYMK
ncbi:hypothetical protein L7F22_040267 [Adiantum nelumboides]|nr:hypothetical protein [Adiantum nelumboides]